MKRDSKRQKKIDQWVTLPLLGGGILTLAVVVVVGLTTLQRLLLGAAVVEPKTPLPENVVQEQDHAVPLQKEGQPPQREEAAVMQLQTPEGEAIKERHPSALETFFSDEIAPLPFAIEPPLTEEDDGMRVSTLDEMLAEIARREDIDEETRALLQEELLYTLNDSAEAAAQATSAAPELLLPTMAEEGDTPAGVSTLEEEIVQLAQRADIDEETRALLQEEFLLSLEEAAAATTDSR